VRAITDPRSRAPRGWAPSRGRLVIGPIKTVGVYVSDSEASLDFYTRVLEFIVRRRVSAGPDATWVEVSPAGAESSLILYPRSRSGGWDERLASVVFHCPDVEATCLDLEKKGVRIKTPPTALPWGMFAVILDPDGNELGLSSQRIAPEVS